MSERALVLFDADHIKDYVFATGRLKEIRGASELVRRLTDADRLIETFTGYQLTHWHTDGPARIIYAAGGAGAILFADPQQAHDFCRDLEARYQEQTISATLTAVAEPVADTSLKEEEAAQRRAARALARRKASKPQIRALPGGGLLRFGATDRLYPAEVQLRDPDGEQLLLSEESARKRKYNRTYRRELPQRTFWKAFIDVLPAERHSNWDGQPSESQDLGSIGDQARPSGYVAFIHLDGDGVGRALRSVVQKGGLIDYRHFSQALDKAAQRATAESLGAAYSNHTPRRSKRKTDGWPDIELPFELITIGGDDVMLICTADQGLRVAQMISTRFGELVNHYLVQHGIELQPPLSASAGVVIAQSSLPIVQLQERAYELLKNAKKRRAAEHAGSQGFLDFQIVTTPSLDRISQLRRHGYQGDDDARFTRRPYRCDQAGTLLNLAAKLAALPEFSNSKRADLYTACAGNRMQATLDVLTVVLRLPADERSALFDALQQLESMSYFPFTYERAGGSMQYRTALLDLLEVMEFIPRR